MNITVTLNLLGMGPTEIRRDTMVFTFEANPRLIDVIERADGENPGLRQAVIDSSGHLAKAFAVLINGDNAAYRGGLDALLLPGEEVNVIPAIAGG